MISLKLLFWVISLKLSFWVILQTTQMWNKLRSGLGTIALLSLAFTLYKLSKRKRKYKDITSLIGNTPLIEITSLSSASGCTILAKAEFLNMGGSPKDRLALGIILHAEAQGLLKRGRGDVIFEGTVGSTGISLATVSKALGYNCHIIMPDDQAKEKYALLEKLGACVEKVRPASIVDPLHFVNLARQRALDLNALDPSPDTPKGYFCNQFENLANLEVHYQTTGPEIYRQTNGHLDAIVLGAGTGGTLAGVAKYLKPRIPQLKVVLADPQGSGLYHKVKHGVLYSQTDAEGSRKRHQVDTIVEGIGLNRLVQNFKYAFDQGWIHDAVQVSDQEAVEMSRYLLKKDGIFVGSSSAVNCAAAYKLAKRLGPGHTILTILCDHGSRHLTKFWYFPRNAHS